MMQNIRIVVSQVDFFFFCECDDAEWPIFAGHVRKRVKGSFDRIEGSFSLYLSKLNLRVDVCERRALLREYRAPLREYWALFYLIHRHLICRWVFMNIGLF